jgi:ComF family protein
VWLDDGARTAAHALKYGGLPRIAVDLAAVMVRTIPAPGAPARLIPIPLGRGRLRRRGYNQSLVLARALASHWRLPVLAQLLIRTRDTATQTALTPGARLANVAGAFAVQSGVMQTRHPLVLVDDVFTTGSTLAEAARTLDNAGFTTISAVTFGRASIPDFS